MRPRPILTLVSAATALAFAPLLIGQPVAREAAPDPDRATIPAGPFIMGTDGRGEPDERPRHTLTLRAFRIDRTEVTRSNWDRCMRAGACSSPREFGPRYHEPTMPVVGVSWSQARAYCQWAGGRLPTEREWEKAGRGTDGRTYPWGEDRPTPRHAVYSRDLGGPGAVGTHPAGDSPFGVHDMAGNVWEWTESPYDPYAYRHPEREPTCETALAALHHLAASGIHGFTGSNPLPTTCERVLRGGAWNYGWDGLRVTNRVHHGPTFRIIVAGLRCADDRV